MTQQTSDSTKAAQHGHEHGFPWQYVLGYVFSLILTIVPLWLVVNHVISMSPLTWAILGCAVLQIVVQLFMFMHFTDSDGGGPAYHVFTITNGLLVAGLFVFASLWIMSFHFQVS